MFVKTLHRTVHNQLRFHRHRLFQLSCLQLTRNSSAPADVALTMNLLSQDRTDSVYIEAISQMGFKLNNNIRIIGPMVAFPKTLLQWNVRRAEDLTIESFSLFTILEPKIDMLIIGIGDKGTYVSPKIADYLTASRIKHQILSTNQAASLFNFLNREDRYVAAALIPPLKVTEPILEANSDLTDLSRPGINLNPFVQFESEEDQEDLSLSDFDSSDLKDVPVRHSGGLWARLLETGGFKQVSSTKDMAERVSERLKRSEKSEQDDKSDTVKSDQDDNSDKKM